MHAMNLRSFTMMSGNKYSNRMIGDFASQLCKTFGPIVRLDTAIGKPPVIFLCDPEGTSQILRGENTLPTRLTMGTLEYYRNNIQKDVKKGCPNGLITENGEVWKKLRSEVNPVLMQSKSVRRYTSTLDEIGMDMVARMKSLRDSNNMIQGNFYREMNSWALESIGAVSLGYRLGCLDPTLSVNSPAQKLISCIYDLFILTDKLDFKFNFWQQTSTPDFKNTMRLYDMHETLSKQLIKHAMEEINTNRNPDDEKGVLEKMSEINEDVAHVMAKDMLLAGVDTTANAMTGILNLLAANPDKQRKLREELWSSEKKRPYLKACIKESLRMMPAVGGTSRVTTRDYSLLGHNIPSGVQVSFVHSNMSLMEEQYPRANEFLPERWLVEKDDPLHYGHAHPFAYNPFGFGVRSCIGRRIAELKLELFTARLVENFQIEWLALRRVIKNRSNTPSNLSTLSSTMRLNNL